MYETTPSVQAVAIGRSDNGTVDRAQCIADHVADKFANRVTISWAQSEPKCIPDRQPDEQSIKLAL